MEKLKKIMEDLVDFRDTENLTDHQYNQIDLALDELKLVDTEN